MHDSKAYSCSQGGSRIPINTELTCVCQDQSKWTKRRWTILFCLRFFQKMHHGNCLCGDNLHSKCKPTLWLAVEFENHGQVLGTRRWTKEGFVSGDHCLYCRSSVFILKGSNALRLGELSKELIPLTEGCFLKQIFYKSWL